jgi:hypothetical protein
MHYRVQVQKHIVVAMSARDDELNLRALNYLMTAVIHRSHETDPEWWREFLVEMKTQRDTPGVDLDDYEVLRRANWTRGALAQALNVCGASLHKCYSACALIDRSFLLRTAEEVLNGSSSMREHLLWL